MLAVLGMAVAAMLALGAFGAGAASAGNWYIGTPPVLIKGGSYAKFTSSGSFQMEAPDLAATFSCSESGAGKILSGGGVEYQGTLSCELAGAEEDCEIAPVQVYLSGSQATTLYGLVPGVLATIKSSGEFCPWYEEIDLGETYPKGGLGFQYGAPSTKLAVSISGTGQFGIQSVAVSGSSTWVLAGGQKFGYW